MSQGTQSGVPTIVEVHLDDLALETGASFEEARRLAECLADVAEAAGARLSLRVRERFAREAAREGAKNILLRLENRGHEIGTHAHGRNLEAARRAVSACHVANQAVTPGFVQAGGSFGGLFDEAARLGFSWLTDAPPRRAWTGAGLIPWRPGHGYSPFQPPLGLVCMEGSVSPMDWGLLIRRHGSLVHTFGLGEAEFHTLAGLRAAHGDRPMPEDVPRYFCFTVHEHNFCPEGSLRPIPESLSALHRFLSSCPVVVSGEMAARCPVPNPVERQREAAPRPVVPRWIGIRMESRLGGWVPLPHGLSGGFSRVLRQGLDRMSPDQKGSFLVPSDDGFLNARWQGPTAIEDLRALLLVSHAGERGGTAIGLEPFGLDPKDLGAAGFAVITWDRRGTGRSGGRGADLTPGNALHVEDFQAVFDHVSRLAPGLPLGVLSFSSGILPPLRSCRPLAFLLDAEAPADRWSLLPPEVPGSPSIGRLASLPIDDPIAWAGREPVLFVGRLECPYHRFQAEYDHVHGRFDTHAIRMVEAARAGRSPDVRYNGGEERPLAGRLHANGRRILGWILEALG